MLRIRSQVFIVFSILSYHHKILSNIKYFSGGNNMLDTLYKLMPTILAFILGGLLYLTLDVENKITDKINFILPMPKKWKAHFSFYFAVILIVIISILGLSIFKLSSNLCFIIDGFVIGLGIGITDKLSKMHLI